jgi:hypothetical protein
MTGYVKLPFCIISEKGRGAPPIKVIVGFVALS